MTRTKTVERWEKICKFCEVTPQANWPIAKSLLKRDGPKAPWSFRHQISPVRKSQRDYRLSGKSHHVTYVRTMNGGWRLESKLFLTRGQQPSWKRCCDVQKIINSLEVCGLDSIPKECLRHLHRRSLVHLTHLSNQCVWLSYFTSSWKEATIITLSKPGKDPKSLQNLRPISLLPTKCKLFQKVILKIVEWQAARNLLDASQIGFREHHSTKLQCMRRTDQVTLNVSNSMYTAAVFLDIEKAFDTTWHLGLLYQVPKFHF
jgi:hypothetical protein